MVFSNFDLEKSFIEVVKEQASLYFKGIKDILSPTVKFKPPRLFKREK